MGGQQADGRVLKDDGEGDLQAQVLLNLWCSAYSIRQACGTQQPHELFD